MKTLLLLISLSLLGLAGCEESIEATHPNVPVAAVIAAATLDAPPQPTPEPEPGGVCDNCNGSGKVGDGTVMVTCMKCGGDGRLSDAGQAGNEAGGCCCLDACACCADVEAKLVSVEAQLQWERSVTAELHERLDEWETFRVKYEAYKAAQSQPEPQTFVPHSAGDCPGGFCPQPQTVPRFNPRPFGIFNN